MLDSSPYESMISTLSLGKVAECTIAASWVLVMKRERAAVVAGKQSYQRRSLNEQTAVTDK